MTYLMRPEVRSTTLLLLLIASTTALADPNEVARQAFFNIEADPFSIQNLRNSGEQLSRAQEAAPNEAWVLIALSRLYLEYGYRKGSRDKLSSYRAAAVEKAREFARQACTVAPEQSMSHIQWARIQIITENYRDAWEALNKAHALDPDDFYPWYYRAVIGLTMKDPVRAEAALEEAERRADAPYQIKWVAGRRIKLARLQDDFKAEETHYKAAIDIDPMAPHPYGNYANFLRKHKRYDEAISYYEKAVSLGSYPLAEEGLRATRLLKDASQR